VSAYLYKGIFDCYSLYNLFLPQWKQYIRKYNIWPVFTITLLANFVSVAGLIAYQLDSYPARQLAGNQLAG